MNMSRMPSLRTLALKHGTDKANHHEYFEAYEFFLSEWRDKDFNMLEIGIGGYEVPDRGGESLRMWFDYFWKAKIYALDIYPKTFTQPRTTIYQGSQDDADLLQMIVSSMNERPRLIIDDASHKNPLTIKTFEAAFPLLLPGGTYVVEDAHTSYWSEHGYDGGFHPIQAMEYFKLQADYLNYDHWQHVYRPQEPYYPQFPGIESIHFFREIIFIRKKL